MEKTNKLAGIANTIKICVTFMLLQGNYHKCHRDLSVNPLTKDKAENNLDKIYDDISDCKDKKGRLYLYHAVKNKNFKNVKMILDQFSKQKISGFKHKNEDFMNTADLETGHTPLGESIIQGNMKIFNLLIKSPYVDCNRISGGKSPLILSFQYGSTKMARSLLQNPNIDISLRDPDTGNTVLHCAIERALSLPKVWGAWSKIASENVVSLMQEQAPHLLYAQNINGDTPLHIAAKTLIGHVSLIVFALCETLSKEHRLIKNNQGKIPYDLFPKYSDQRILFKPYFCQVSVHDFSTKVLCSPFFYDKKGDKK
ncbi:MULTISPECIES: ankyrin repeat domain-containing protein [Candidatus Cardinium]|uniref:ankyrin repeat domain-containing protein n=1 Tax=Candidatus Cardinium TaxID=273135 RepID=UPI001FA9FD05|nr:MULTISPECIES: ankyrin repeat domain-containing protein [Cardinium]